MLVRDAMTPNPITVSTHTTLPRIDEIMRESHIRRVPVLNDEGRLVGIITDHDVMTNLPSPATTLSRWEMNALLDKLEARDFMTSPVYTTTPDCPLEEVARYLLEHKIGALPVMEQDELVGIVTESDVFRIFAAMLSGDDEPGLRMEVRAERHRGVLGELAAIVNKSGGRIITMATLNEADGIHKRFLVKESGADAASLRNALEAADFEVRDVRQRRQCTIRAVGGR